MYIGQTQIFGAAGDWYVTATKIGIRSMQTHRPFVYLLCPPPCRDRIIPGGIGSIPRDNLQL